MAGSRGIPVDTRLRVRERLWAIGDVTGIWPLTHVGKYQGRVVAANILGESREAHYEPCHGSPTPTRRRPRWARPRCRSARARSWRTSPKPPPTRTPTP